MNKALPRYPQVSVRVSPGQMEKIKAAAHKSRRPVADFMRLVALDEAEKVLEHDGRLSQTHPRSILDNGSPWLSSCGTK
jgi:uncharacterized protein (DUF1778 family)